VIFKYVNKHKAMWQGIVLFTLGMIFLGGCQSTPVGKIKRPVKILTTSDQIIDHISGTLKAYGFEIEHINRTSGLVQTLPLQSRQWFEFWRKDVDGFAEISESSLQDIRRVIAVTFKKEKATETKSQFEVDVVVTVQRRIESDVNKPVAQKPRGIFNNMVQLIPAITSTKDAQWIIVDRDPRFENKLLSELSLIPWD